MAAGRFGLVLLCCAALVTVASAQGNCGQGLLFCPGINQCYSSNNYVCLAQPQGGGKFLCPTGAPCLCGQIACYSSTQYGCKDGGLTQNTADKGGVCGGGSGGDPLVRNFDGCRWYMEGVPDKVYNLVAGVEDTVNTLLVPANLTDSSHDGTGTFHGTLSFRHGDDTVLADVSAEGNLTVTVNGQVQPFDSRFHVGDIKGKVVQHMTFFGQYAEINTPSFTYAVQAVQPVATETGMQRGHADLDITLRKAVAGLHGLLGQSVHSIQSPLCREDYAFPGEGTEADYQVSELSSVPEGLIPIARASRKLIEEDATYLLPVTASVAA